MSDVYKELYEANKKIEEMREDFRKIKLEIICIGGPLNDNVLNYTNKQLVPFTRILNIARYWESPPQRRNRY